MNDGCDLRPTGKRKNSLLLAGIHAFLGYCDFHVAIAGVNPQVGVSDFATRFSDVASVECWAYGSKSPSFLHAFSGFRQISVAVAVQVQDIAVEDQPDAEVRLRTEDQQAILRLILISWFLGDGALDLGEVDSRGRWR